MKLRQLRLVAIVLVIGALVIFLFTDLFGPQPFGWLPKIGLQRVTKTQTSSITLEQVRNLYALNTMQLVHRTVFPYDYMPEGVSLPAVLRKLRTTNTTVRDTLTDDEYLYLSAFNLAEQVNLGVSGGTFDFIVVTLVLTAGFDLSTTPGEMSIEEYINAEGGTGRRILVDLGPPSIVDTTIEDIDPGDYPYPNAALSPEGWRRVTEFVRTHAVSDERKRELLDLAMVRGQTFVTDVLEQAGFSEVVFR